jgi:hypothetical protein
MVLAKTPENHMDRRKTRNTAQAEPVATRSRSEAPKPKVTP